MQNVVGPTLVAMATKIGLGAEIQSPTGLFVFSVVSVITPEPLVLSSLNFKDAASYCGGKGGHVQQ